MPSSSRRAPWRGLASFSISMWASRATNAPSSVRARDSRLRDHLLRLEVGDREQVGEVAPPHVVGVAGGDLLDVDPAHVAEQHHGPLAGAVPDHAGVVLLGALYPGVDQEPAVHVA